MHICPDEFIIVSSVVSSPWWVRWTWWKVKDWFRQDKEPPCC